MKKLQAIAKNLCDKAGRLAHKTDDKTKSDYYKAANKAIKAGFTKEQVSSMAKAALDLECSKIIAGAIL